MTEETKLNPANKTDDAPKTDSTPQDCDAANAKTVRQRIVDAALELAQTVGVQGMSQARVATAAGVRQSHLTYYFPTRADLIKATVHAIRDQIFEATQAVLQIKDHTGNPLDVFREFCMREVCDLPKARMLLSIMVIAEQESSLHPWIDEFHKESVAQWQTMYRALGINASEDEVELFHATFVGATLLCAQTGSEEARQRALRVTQLAFDRLLLNQKQHE